MFLNFCLCIIQPTCTSTRRQFGSFRSSNIHRFYYIAHIKPSRFSKPESPQTSCNTVKDAQPGNEFAQIAASLHVAVLSRLHD